MDILIQFHAALEELTQFLCDVTEEIPVHVTAFRFAPFRATQVDISDLELTMQDTSVRELALTLEPPLPAGTASDFAGQNPSALRLDIGRLSEQGLRESCLSVRTTDDGAILQWKKVAQRLRKITQAGAIAVNPVTGATSRLRSHRFTPRAKQLDDDGVAIRPVAGSALLHLGHK
jgi:hypothetical protein